MKKGRFGTVKTLLASALTIGAIAGGFWGTTNLVVAAESDKVVSLPTSYSVEVVTPPTVQRPESETEDIIKPVYTLVDNDLEYYRDKKPTVNDISREAAAEIGVNALTKVFGIDLHGKEIEMTYQPSERGLRAQWLGDWWYNGKKNPDDLYVSSYSFTVDAVSGELQFINHNRVLPSSDTPGPGYDLLTGSDDYSVLAQEAALQYGAIYGEVKTVEYSGQGSTNNDPLIWYDLTGTGGERARISLSRHDKSLVGVTYDDGIKWTDESIQLMHQEQLITEQRAQEYFDANPDANTYYDEEFKAQIDRAWIERAALREAAE